jgi:osmotically-inducible protein OsmY
MKRIRSYFVVAGVIVSLTSMSVFAQTAAPDNSGTAPNNTGTNMTQRANGMPTADQQSNDKSDVELTREIRHSLVSDSSLSIDAHNVKIVSKNGSVTLLGPVQNDNERSAIGAKAEAIAGAGKVSNQLQVKPQ